MYSVFPLLAQSLHAGFVIFKGCIHPAQDNFFYCTYICCGLLLMCFTDFKKCVYSLALCYQHHSLFPGALKNFSLVIHYFFADKSHEYTICDVLPFL